MDNSCPRVVLDTNCLISALLFSRGVLSQLRTLWQEKRFIPLLCSSTAKELIRVLSYPKFKLTPEDIQDILSDILPWAEVVELSPKASELDYIHHLRDPKDTDFILLAEQEKASVLVSGDKHLLELKPYASIPIMLPVEFLETIQATSSIQRYPP